MIDKNQKILQSDTILKSLQKMIKSGSKTLCVVDKKNKLLGTFSDGDLRKIIIKNVNLHKSIDGYFNQNPTFFYENGYNLEDIQNTFSKDNFDIIPIVSKEKYIKKILSWNELLNENTKIKSNKNYTPVLIMAGGIGERLKPFTNILPKPLIPINGKPVIDIIIQKFIRLGFQKFLISKNINDTILKSYLSNHKLKNKIKFINEKKQLGTAGSLFLTKKEFTKNILVINCDVILDIDFRDLINFHEVNKNDATIVVTEIKYKIPYGNVQVTTKNKFKSITEKPEYDILTNTGCYVFGQRIKKLLNKQEKIDMNHFIKKLTSKNLKIQIYKISKDKWYDTGQWREFENTQKEFINY